MNLSDLVPLLRLPLILTSSVAIGLTYGSLSHWSFSWNGHRSTPCGLAITLIISLTTTILFLTKHLYYRFAKQNTTAYHLRKLALYAIAAASDFNLFVALMVLHVLNVIESGKRDHPTILMMYAAFGALVASVFHFVLGVSSVHVCFKTWISYRPKCPTCHQPVNRAPIYVSIQTGVHDEECSKYNLTMAANEEGSEDGDCLIRPEADE